MLELPKEMTFYRKIEKSSDDGAFVREMIWNIEVRQISDEELLERIGEEEVNTESVRKLKSKNPKLMAFRKSSYWITCAVSFYFLSNIKNIFLLYLGKATYVKDLLCKTLNARYSIQRRS